MILKKIPPKNVLIKNGGHFNFRTERRRHIHENFKMAITRSIFIQLRIFFAKILIFIADCDSDKNPKKMFFEEKKCCFENKKNYDVEKKTYYLEK